MIDSTGNPYIDNFDVNMRCRQCGEKVPFDLMLIHIEKHDEKQAESRKNEKENEIKIFTQEEKEKIEASFRKGGENGPDS